MTAPAGNATIEISLRTFTYANPMREAEYLDVNAAAPGGYAGYKLVAITPVTYRDLPAAVWRFNWKHDLLSHMTMLEYLFGRATPAAGRITRSRSPPLRCSSRPRTWFST